MLLVNRWQDFRNHPATRRLRRQRAKAWVPRSADPEHRMTIHFAAALRHFALFGLAAADRAEQEARNADAQSDRDGVAHWLGICKTLDPRRARDAERNLTRGRATKMRR